MSHVRRFASVVCGGLLLAWGMESPAATKVGEGFASQYELNGRFTRPTNRIDEGAMDQHAYYWIQWRNHPVGRSTFRCKVIHKESAAVIVDEEITYADSPAEGYSLCGFTPRKEVNREGAYIFTQYLDGTKVGQSTLRIETRYFENFRLFPWKIALLLFAVAILALGVLGRKGGGLHPGVR
jgi:hypothetical protein